MKLPPIGLGTWNLRGKECTEVVAKALDIGYRHIDTAHVYENHEAIRKSIKSFDRSLLFLTSKLALKQVHLENIEKSVSEACDLALKELGVDYLDLYLIHTADHTLPLEKIFHAMEQLVEKGKIHRAGVSNFTIHHLQDLLREKGIPTANQVEFHPYLYQKGLWDFCKSQQIELIAYRPFGKGKLLEKPLFKTIGGSYKKNGAQVILRWLFQKEIPTVPKASSEDHLHENIDIFDFSLSDSEMDQLDSLHKNSRFCMPESSEFAY